MKYWPSSHSILQARGVPRVQLRGWVGGCGQLLSHTYNLQLHCCLFAPSIYGTLHCVQYVLGLAVHSICTQFGIGLQPAVQCTHTNKSLFTWSPEIKCTYRIAANFHCEALKAYFRGLIFVVCPDIVCSGFSL